MNIEKDFLWNEKDGYAVLEKYLKKYGGDEEVETVINIPSEYNGKAVKEIFDAAFATNLYIEEVNFPDTVEKIGCMTFNQSPNLKKVKLSKNLRRLGYFALNETALKEENSNWTGDMLIVDGWLVAVKESAKNITIPNTVVGIADYAFYFNGNLKKVVIPKSVKSIGMRAFAFALSLDEVYIPSTVEYAHWQIFGANVEIKKLTIPQEIYENQKFEPTLKIGEIVLL